MDTKNNRRIKGKWLRIFGVVVIAALAQLACEVGGVNISAGTPVGLESDKLVPAVTPVSLGEPLYEEDFSDLQSGWDHYDGIDGQADYYEGGYRLLVHQTDWMLWANPGRTFRNVRIELDTQKLGGDDDNIFGVLCRYQDLENFYAFAISSDGYYGILKRQAGSSMQYVQMDSMRPSPSIKLGEPDNHLAVECDGDRLRLFINDVLVDDVRDADFVEGDIGLIAGTFSQPETEILFSNLKVYNLDR